jgi:hypothetical protein
MGRATGWVRASASRRGAGSRSARAGGRVRRPTSPTRSRSPPRTRLLARWRSCFVVATDPPRASACALGHLRVTALLSPMRCDRRLAPWGTSATASGGAVVQVVARHPRARVAALPRARELAGLDRAVPCATPRSRRAIDRPRATRRRESETTSAAWSATSPSRRSSTPSPSPERDRHPTRGSRKRGRRAFRARLSMWKRRCDRLQEGTGFVRGDNLVVTNAHVIAGGEAVLVSTRRQSPPWTQLVAFDPIRPRVCCVSRGSRCRR